MPRRPHLVLLAALALLLGAGTPPDAIAGPTDPTPTPVNAPAPQETGAYGPVIYVGDMSPPAQAPVGSPLPSEGEAGINVAAADGSRVTRLGPGRGRPTWSPDGTRLAFVDGDGLGVMNADGSGRVRLPVPVDTGLAVYYGPSWSPDGTRMAVEGTGSAIWLVDADGSAMTRLPPARGGDRWPAWSPDGARIAFVAGPGQTADVYAVNADGSGRTRLTDLPGAVISRPAWSPDGARLAVAIEEFLEASEAGGIYVVDADGSGLAAVTEWGRPGAAGPPYARSPVWSPDGTRLAVVSAVSATSDAQGTVVVLAADGSGRTDLGPGAELGEPSWSPDGARIAFGAFEAAAGSWEVQVAEADGSGRIRIGTPHLDDTAPAWSPDGTRIAFASAPPRAGGD